MTWHNRADGAPAPSTQGPRRVSRRAALASRSYWSATSRTDGPSWSVTGILTPRRRSATRSAPSSGATSPILRGSPAAASDRPPAPELSPGELKVLRYLPTNLSRFEIASELSLSRNTVSTHIKSIYAKLGVSDRSAAVRRARSLQLLSAGRTR
jgi:DNA-binding CsgD family transcriptional regulator